MRLPSKNLRWILALLVAAALGWSFWRSAGWLQLCAGLALFLFGLQCLEEGLRQLAGGKLEQLLARSTGTPLKAFRTASSRTAGSAPALGGRAAPASPGRSTCPLALTAGGTAW